MRANEILVVSVAAAVVAAALLVIEPSKAVNAIVGLIGLEDQQVGLRSSETGDEKSSDRSAVEKGQSQHGTRKRKTGAKEISVEKAILAQTGSGAGLLPSFDPKTESGLSDNAHSRLFRRADIKVSSIERGRLIERYMWINGRIMLVIDGQVMPDRSSPIEPALSLRDIMSPGDLH